MNSYELSRTWFDFAFENPEKITPSHAAIYFFAIEHNNRLGWREKFGFPTQMACDAIGINKPQTLIKYFNDLVEWGFIKVIERSKNQYSANIISLISAKPKNGKALDKALDKAIVKHAAKQSLSTRQSISPIDKPLTNEPLTNELLTTKQKQEQVSVDFSESLFQGQIEKPKKTRTQKTVFIPPTVEDMVEYFKTNGYSEAAARKAHMYYSSANWVDASGKPVLNWKQKMIMIWFKDENKLVQDKPKTSTAPRPVGVI